LSVNVFNQTTRCDSRSTITVYDDDSDDGWSLLDMPQETVQDRRWVRIID